jgi:hypothetical protein
MSRHAVTLLYFNSVLHLQDLSWRFSCDMCIVLVQWGHNGVIVSFYSQVSSPNIIILYRISIKLDIKNLHKRLLKWFNSGIWGFLRTTLSLETQIKHIFYWKAALQSRFWYTTYIDLIRFCNIYMKSVYEWQVVNNIQRYIIKGLMQFATECHMLCYNTLHTYMYHYCISVFVSFFIPHVESIHTDWFGSWMDPRRNLAG